MLCRTVILPPPLPLFIFYVVRRTVVDIMYVYGSWTHWLLRSGPLFHCELTVLPTTDSEEGNAMALHWMIPYSGISPGLAMRRQRERNYSSVNVVSSLRFPIDESLKGLATCGSK